MDEYFLQAFLFAQLQDRVQMCVVAVYAAVREQTPDMQVGIVLLAVLDCAQQFFVLEEYAVFDVLGDQGQVLVDDAAGADVHMTPLGISHLAIRKTNCQTAGVAFYKRTLCFQLIHNRCVCDRDGIGLRIVGQAVTIQHH